jgi:hypothetical protein
MMKMQIAGWDVPAVLLGHHLQGFLARAILTLTGNVAGLHFPALKGLSVLFAAGGAFDRNSRLHP